MKTSQHVFFAAALFLSLFTYCSAVRKTSGNNYRKQPRKETKNYLGKIIKDTHRKIVKKIEENYRKNNPNNPSRLQAKTKKDLYLTTVKKITELHRKSLYSSSSNFKELVKKYIETAIEKNTY